MAQLVSVQQFKRGILVLLVAALAFSAALSVQGALAQRDPVEEGDPYELLIMSLQIDFLCSNNYTGIDRVGDSITIFHMLRDFQNGQVQSLDYFDSPCQPHETGRLSLSINPAMLMNLFNSAPPASFGR